MRYFDRGSLKEACEPAHDPDDTTPRDVWEYQLKGCRCAQSRSSAHDCRFGEHNSSLMGGSKSIALHHAQHCLDVGILGGFAVDRVVVVYICARNSPSWADGSTVVYRGSPGSLRA